MTRQQALNLVKFYEQAFCQQPFDIDALTQITTRWPANGSAQKAMRWLGFMQGAAFSYGLFTLQEIKEHSKDPDKWTAEKTES